MQRGSSGTFPPDWPELINFLSPRQRFPPPPSIQSSGNSDFQFQFREVRGARDKFWLSSFAWQPSRGRAISAEKHIRYVTTGGSVNFRGARNKRAYFIQPWKNGSAVIETKQSRCAPVNFGWPAGSGAVKISGGRVLYMHFRLCHFCFP